MWASTNTKNEKDKGEYSWTEISRWWVWGRVCPGEGSRWGFQASWLTLPFVNLVWGALWFNPKVCPYPRGSYWFLHLDEHDLGYSSRIRLSIATALDDFLIFALRRISGMIWWDVIEKDLSRNFHGTASHTSWWLWCYSRLSMGYRQLVRNQFITTGLGRY